MTGPTSVGEADEMLSSDAENQRLTDESFDTSRSLSEAEPERAPTDESVEVVRTPSETIQILPSNGDPSELENDPGGTSIAPLTRRLRCLFSTVTWPIVPLGTVVTLALAWVLYAAFVLDLRRSCSHPLHWYAGASLVLVSYAPHHAQVRSHLFRYSRERDGPIRPRRVRMYDQLFHTLCLFYVYGGVTLLQTCHDDELKDLVSEDELRGSDQPSNTCEVTCPNLHRALSVYVTTLEMFTIALILPLLFLPCIYLWILRRATEEMDAFAQLHDRLEEEEALLAGEGVTAEELMDSLESVQLISKKKPDGTRRTDVVRLDTASSEEGSSNMRDGSNVKECCICMTEFEIQNEEDLESGSSYSFLTSLSPQNRRLSPLSENEPAGLGSINDVDLSAVRTKCGHVFHRRCLAGWIGGRWQQAQQEGNEDPVRRRARRTCCPLCREDLKPRTEYQSA